MKLKSEKGRSSWRLSPSCMADKILIIDDDKLVISSISRLLSKSGYEIKMCMNGDEAIELVRNEAFDLIICDVLMPGRDGVDTITRITEIQQKEAKKTPVLFITGFADIQLETRAQELNPVGYILKPFDTGNFLDVIRKTLN